MIERIDRLGIVGTGQMGRGIAQIAAAGGVEVRLHDARAGAAEEARRFVAQMLGRLVDKGRMSAGERDAALARLQVVERLEDLAGCQAVVEAIVEDLETKRQLFVDLEAIVEEDCILATNTSSLSVTAIAAACRRPDRVAGFHFFNPVPLMKVVEIVDGVRTAPAVCDTLAELAGRMGHTAVRARDTPGFLVNHAGRGYGTEALRIVGEGVCDFAAVDRVMREAAGFPMGPFELMDLTGLDVSDPVMRSIYHQFYEEPRFRPSPLTAQRAAAGLYGRKAGAGFYRYRDGKREEPDEPGETLPPPQRVWVSHADREAQARIAAALEEVDVAVELESRPSPDALCLVTPMGVDATRRALDEKLDPAQTLAVDVLLPLDRRVTVMASPATTEAAREQARALFLAAGRKVTLVADSPGFIAQRILACVVNIACEIAQMKIATPDDIDRAVRLGLGYPKGPLAWGDELGPARVLAVLRGLQARTGDMRYRPSLWLTRRAELGLSLHAPNLAIA
jgi:3-hydroxybutyryl-CoA dehydrogenase